MNKVYIIFIYLISMCLFSCAQKQPTPDVESTPVVQYVVIFDVDGAQESIEVKKGENASEPATPEKEGYIFLGWYLNDEKYNFNTAITSDITLVARFEEIKQTSEDTQYEVTFDVDGTKEIVKIKEGEKVSKPVDPVKEGYIFLGWYNDKDFSNPYDFEITITEDTILFAIFKIAQFDVSLIVDGEEFEIISLDYNSVISIDLIPIVDKTSIDGIYYDEKYENKYCGELIKEDLVLYIKLIDGYVCFDDQQIAKYNIMNYFNWNGGNQINEFHYKMYFIIEQNATLYQFERNEIYYIAAYYNDYDFYMHKDIDNIIWRKYDNIDNYDTTVNGHSIIGMFRVEKGIIKKDLSTNCIVNKETKLVYTVFSNTSHPFSNYNFIDSDEYIIYNNCLSELLSMQEKMNIGVIPIPVHWESDCYEIYEENDKLFMKYYISETTEEILMSEFGEYYESFKNIIIIPEETSFDRKCIVFMLDDLIDILNSYLKS